MTTFKLNGKQYDVIVQVDPADRTPPQDLLDIFVRTPSGSEAQLSNLVRLEETLVWRELNHFNKLHSATISATVAPGTILCEALAALDAAAARVLPPTVQENIAGMSREFRTTSASLALTFVLALVLFNSSRPRSSRASTIPS